MCHSSGTAARNPAHCRALMVAFVPACSLRWMPGLAWELPVTSARDCDITKWRCREGAGGLRQRSSQGPSKMGDPKKNRAGACWGLARRAVCLCWESSLLPASSLCSRAPWNWLCGLGSLWRHGERIGLWALRVRSVRVYLGLGSPALLPRALFLALRFNHTRARGISSSLGSQVIPHMLRAAYFTGPRAGVTAFLRCVHTTDSHTARVNLAPHVSQEEGSMCWVISVCAHRPTQSWPCLIPVFTAFLAYPPPMTPWG